VFAGSCIVDNLADKPRKLGISLIDSRKSGSG
jgi:hypothetical protein